MSCFHRHTENGSIAAGQAAGSLMRGPVNRWVPRNLKGQMYAQGSTGSNSTLLIGPWSCTP